MIVIRVQNRIVTEFILYYYCNIIAIAGARDHLQLVN